MYQRKDTFYTRAKTAGYRSRAAFKLQQLVEHRRLLRRGDCVVELGAWPGGWLQLAARHVGPNGRVIGVDVRAIAPLPEANVLTVRGDIEDRETQDRVVHLCGGKADVLFSDLAPKLSGVQARDQAQQAALANGVLHWAARVLKPGGTLVVKLFTGNELKGYASRLRRLFQDVQLTRPAATRKGSAEIYAVATGFRVDLPAA